MIKKLIQKEGLIQEFLRLDASLIRKKYLNKELPEGYQRVTKKPKSNVAVIEIYLTNKTSFTIGATSKRGFNLNSRRKIKSPIPKPKPKSEGGQFKPIIDPYSGRSTPMDTDAEYKALSALADILDLIPKNQHERKLYLYTEKKPCQNCQGVLEEFQKKYPSIDIAGIYWDHPYP